MTSTKLTKLIRFSFMSLFFFTPLLISFSSSELFEFPKMLFVYLMTTIIVCLWLYNITLQGKIYFRHSYFDPIFILILITQTISTILSIEPHTSLFGYYSRFHGGLFSTLCYLLLAWAFITHADRSWIKNIFLTSLFSASLIATFAIAEHFGIDSHIWIQDVANRVFSTLGQPNWLSAFLLCLLPISIHYSLHPPRSYFPTFNLLTIINLIISYFIIFFFTQVKLPYTGLPLFYFIALFTFLSGFTLSRLEAIDSRFPFLRKIIYPLLSLIFFTAILFTKSRSGLIALFTSLFIYFISSIFRISSPCAQGEQTVSLRVRKNLSLKKTLLLIACYLLLVAIIGTEWTPNFSQIIGKSTRSVKNPLVSTPRNPNLPTLAETVSDSTDIRKIVWQGAIDVFRHYPLFGSGTETFGYSYYQFRPRAHNDLSEWDFLYNKAHNEYLNFLANNGIIGTFAIFLLISAILISTIKSYFKNYQKLFLAFLIITIATYFLSPNLIIAVINKLLIYPPLIFYLGIPFILSFLSCLLLFKPKNFISHSFDPLILAILTVIVITNFYGFSVVNIALIFFLLPTFLVISKNQTTLFEKKFAPKSYVNSNQNIVKISGSIFISTFCLFLLISIFNYFLADKLYNQAKTYTDTNRLLEAELKISQALSLKKEAYYYLQQAKIKSKIAYSLFSADPSDSTDLITKYVLETQQSLISAIEKNPVHQSVLKPGASVYLTLAYIDTSFYTQAKTVLELAQKLSPTDAQLSFNIAMLNENLGLENEALAQYEQAVKLKPNYRPAWLYLAKFYENHNQIEKATQIYHFILENIDRSDGTSLEKLKLNKS